MKRSLMSLLLLSLWSAIKAQDMVIYDLSSQPNCTLVKRERTNKCEWAAGLDMTDVVVEGGRIIAYKIFWNIGTWSDWYVPGLNDIDVEFNLLARPCPMAYTAKSMRRRWANFYDRPHEFIICKPN